MSVQMQLYHDNFQNYKKYGIPKAQLVIADIPYNIGANAYASNPEWYVDGNNKNGESKKAKKCFFNTDGNFKAAEIGRHSYGFEVDRKMYGLAKEKMLVLPEEMPVLFSEDELRQSTI